MKLSQNFWLYEFTKSQTAKRLGIKNKPTGEHVRALKRLCENVLQPIRDHFGSPVTINSGYRSPGLNTKINGSMKSQHMRGEAADFEISGISNLTVAKWIAASDLLYDQLILEFHDENEGPNDGWIHVSHTGGLNRRQVLRASRISGVTVYARDLD